MKQATLKVLFVVSLATAAVMLYAQIGLTRLLGFLHLESWGSLVVSGALAVGALWRWFKLSLVARLWILLSAFGWSAYVGYETNMQHWVTTVSAPIRLDLLIIYPLLALLAGVSVVLLYRTLDGKAADDA